MTIISIVYRFNTHALKKKHFKKKFSYFFFLKMALIGWYRSWRGTGNGAWKKTKKNKKKPTTTKKKKQKNKNKRRTTTTTTTTTKKRTDDGFDPATLAEPAETKEITLWFFFLFFIFYFYFSVWFLFFWLLLLLLLLLLGFAFCLFVFFFVVGREIYCTGSSISLLFFPFFLLPGLGRSSFVFFVVVFSYRAFFLFFSFLNRVGCRFTEFFFPVSMEPSPKALYLVLLGFDLMTTSSFT